MNPLCSVNKPEGFQIKAMGTIEAAHTVQEEIKKKKCQAINHVLMGQENLTRANIL